MAILSNDSSNKEKSYKDMTAEEKTKYHNKQKEKFYKMKGKLESIKHELFGFKSTRGHSEEYKLLEIALNKMIDKINVDHQRYKLRIKRQYEKDIVKDLQQSLNRERKLRHDLEKKVEEASISGGLFIKYVRNKLKI